MDNALEKWGKSGKFAEVFEVVKTTIVNKQDRVYRVEVQQSYANPDVQFLARCDAMRRLEGGTQIWVDCPLFVANQATADAALEDALGFLAAFDQ